MKDKIQVLASTIINHSIKVNSNENVRITCETMDPMPLVKELVRLINEKGANVEVSFFDPMLKALINKGTTPSKLYLLKELEEVEVTKFDSFIRIYCNQGDYMDSIVPDEITKSIGEDLKKYRDIRVNEKKWVLLNYPSKVDAQKAKMAYDEFANVSFDAMW